MATNYFTAAFKTEVKLACLLLLKARIHHASVAMKLAQETANGEEKSSVGDKHETARAISQNDRDMNAAQLDKAQREYLFLESINTAQINNHVTLGSLFELGDVLFFVATGLGSVMVLQRQVMVISHKSPLFEQLKMKRIDEVVMFKNEQKKITNLC
jgi:hypothetical protein